MNFDAELVRLGARKFLIWTTAIMPRSDIEVYKDFYLIYPLELLVKRCSALLLSYASPSPALPCFVLRWEISHLSIAGAI